MTILRRWTYSDCNYFVPGSHDRRFVFISVSWWCDPLVPQVMITSHRRSISQAFWGAEQAKDNEGGVEASTMQGTITRLEADNAR